MLRKIRIFLAAISILCCTLLFVDFTGMASNYLGWMAKLQFVPAFLALNVFVVMALIVLTLLLGRVYCSVICPLGILQDIIAWVRRRIVRKKYSFSLEKKWLRRAILLLFIVSMALSATGIVAKLIEPYSAFGRIASNLFAPIWQWGNNALAAAAESADSYLFYSTEVYVRNGVTLAVAAVSFIVIAILAWRGGRTYCNTVCPVGTFLGFFSRFALLKPIINSEKCINCKACETKCKASCIDLANHKIDHSRCVACMDCIDACRKDALTYCRTKKGDSGKSACLEEEGQPENSSRRAFLITSATLTATAAIKAQEKKVDGGLAIIKDRKEPERKSHIVPPGAKGVRHFSQHCTSCQLCVSTCPEHVLVPSGNLHRFMQPEMSYDRGYCRPECTHCSEVCPNGAIMKLTEEEKSSVQIGHAVWIKKNCVVITDGVRCGNCAHHCPAGAITMVPLRADDETSPWVPAVNTERCIGCGACEHLCPARPYSAIYVEGHERHREI